MNIYFECDNDKALLKSLSVGKKNQKHSFSKGNVCNSLKKVNDSIGMVDEDPTTNENKYIVSLGNPVRKDFNIKIFTDNNRNNKIVMLCPRLEEWLYFIAKCNNINPTDFELPKLPGELHKLEFQKVKTRLFNFLEKLQNSPEMIYLKTELSKV